MYIFDEENLYPLIDNVIENVDENILLQAREELIKNNQSTDVIDKALINKKKNNSIVNNTKKKKPSIFSRLNKTTKNTDNNELMEWEQREVDNGNYEPNNFEEEELTEDDFYSEDDK